MPDIDGRGQRESRFRALYEEHYRSVQAYAMRRVGSHEDVADVVAEVFTIAWRRLVRIPEPPDDRLWLYGVARRVVAGRRRSAQRLRQLTARLGASQVTGGQPGAHARDPGEDPALRAVRSTDSERLAAAIARLRPAEREALALVLWDEVSHAEAARVLGCSVNAVAIRVHRAKARLREALTGTDQPGELGSPVPAAAETNRS